MDGHPEPNISCYPKTARPAPCAYPNSLPLAMAETPHEVSVPFSWEPQFFPVLGQLVWLLSHCEKSLLSAPSCTAHYRRCPLLLEAPSPHSSTEPQFQQLPSWVPTISSLPNSSPCLPVMFFYSVWSCTLFLGNMAWFLNRWAFSVLPNWRKAHSLIHTVCGGAVVHSHILPWRGLEGWEGASPQFY